ncbi:helix-turn-helix domain-containing protein [Intrasporangium sp.]|uniref:PucR family transcriptional regulator n=1 Tax=Intrasporangium sp. TaxID=1925024 RepID=UPI003221AC80
MALDLQEIVDLASELLEQPALLEDRDFNLVAFHSQNAGIDAVRQRSILERSSTPQVRAWFEQFGIATAAGPVSTPVDPEHGTLGRLCVPARWNGVNHGYLWVLDPDGRIAGRPAVAEVRQLAGHAGALLAQRAMGRYDVSILLDSLLSPDPARAARAAAELVERGLVGAGDPVAVMQVRLQPADGSVPVNVWTLPRGVVAAVDPDHATLLVRLAASGDPSPATRLAAEIRRQHEARVGPGWRGSLVIGIGEAQPSVRSARTSHRQATLAARVAELDGRSRTAAWAELGVYRLLGCGPESELTAAVVDDRVRRLLDEGDGGLARTARVFLDEAGSVQRTSARLGIHRQTAYHRFRRIQELTGLDLGRGADRLVLHLGLTLAPLLAPPDARV